MRGEGKSWLRVWRAMAIKADVIGSIQVGAGMYLACFFASHVSAVFRTRYLRDVDINWDWLTSAPLLSDQWSRGAPLRLAGAPRRDAPGGRCVRRDLLRRCAHLLFDHVRACCRRRRLAA